MKVICPNFNNKEVKQQFDELVANVGENAAYVIWSENNGNSIDQAPNGAESKLLSDLLSYYNGDRNAAIKAKAKTFAQSFKTWFGESKVVDANGEPMIVWHGTEYSFEEFELDTDNVRGKHLFHKNVGFFFTDRQDKALKYKHANTIPVYLSLQNPGESSVVKDGVLDNLHKENQILEDDRYDSAVFVRYDKEGDMNGKAPTTQYVAKSSNQIKSIDNEGAFSTQSNNIYAKDISTNSESSVLDRELFSKFKEITNSRQAIQQLLDLGLVPAELTDLAKLMQTFDIPIQFSDRLSSTNKNYAALYYHIGKIEIFSPAFNAGVLTNTILHEMIHFHTVYALKKPRPGAETEFKEQMEKIYDRYKRDYAGSTHYGLTDVFEFVAEIQTNLKFRKALQQAEDRSLWDLILDAFRKLFRRKLSTSTSNIRHIDKMVEQITQYGIQNGVNVMRDSSGASSANIVSQSEQLHTDIITGLKQRLNAIQRYAVDRKRVQNEYAMQKLIDDLSKADSVTAVTEFVSHINDTIADAVKFFTSDLQDINSKQLVQLRRDYLNYYGPMLRNISSLIENTDELKGIPNYALFEANVDDLISKFNKIQVKYDQILKQKTRQFLSSYASSSGSPFTSEMLDWIDNPTNDIGWIAQYVGMASNTDNEIVRIMENMIRNVKNKVDRNTRSIGQGLLPLLDVAKKKHGNDVMSLLQERNADGTRTGYFVRDRNYGKFYKDRKDFYDQQAIKYQLEKNDESIYILPTDQAQLRKYQSELNDWLNAHTERLFVKEYYDLRNNMQQVTKDAISQIAQQAAMIRKKYTIDKVFYNHRMTAQDQEQLKTLVRQKAALANIYDINGRDKTGTDLIIANDLTRFNDAVGDNIKYNKQSKKFLDTMSKMYKLLPANEYAQWYNFNTHSEYSDEFWRQLDALDRIEQSSDYKELKDRQKAIMKMYQKDNSFEYDVDAMDSRTVAAIKDIDAQLAQLYSKTPKQPGTQFKDIAQIVLSDEYNKQYSIAQQAGTMYFNDWYERNHYEDAEGISKPISIWTYIKPVNDKFIVNNVPNMMFSEVASSSKFLNDKYDQSGEYIQPKLSLYDNRKQYDQIQNSKELKDLYDKLLDVMTNSTKAIGFLQNADPYKLPQMTARTFQMVARNSNVFKGLKYAMMDHLGVKDDDKDYVNEFQLSPDGTPIKNIPTRYLNLLDDPNMITADVVGSVIEFYNMSENFKQMSSVQDDLEMILTRLSQLEVTGKKGKTAGELNVFKKAQQLIDMNMYGQKKQRLEFEVRGKKVELGKGLGTLYQYITKVNLAYNMWAIGANYITGQGYTDMESILGRYYDTSDIAFAKAELLKNMPENTVNLGNVNVQNKLLSLMQLNQVTRTNEETYNRLDNSAAIRAINQHFWFNGYTAGDFVVKSQVLAAIYHSYRLYDGSFMNKNEFISKYYANDRKAGAAKFAKLKVTLYDAYDTQGNIVDAYTDMVDSKLQNKITNKIRTLAQKIDGNLSDTDKSAIHANMFAHFLVMHRNFMIVGIQDRFKGKQYNYNTGEVEVGTYRTIGKLISQQFSSDKMFALRQLMDNYNNLEDYEKYNVKKFMLELANITTLSLAVSLLLVPLADSGDGEDLWAMQAITYLAMRAAFEFRTLYNPLELTALLNSPSAAFNSINNMASMIKLLWIPNWSKDGIFKEASSGPYKGMPKILKNFIKFTPAKNIIEAADPKPKRNYLQNQLMM